MSARVSKNQQRINTILKAIPRVREQLLVAMEEFGSDFEEALFLIAGQSSDARERNKVAVVEREYEVLLNRLHELAARGLAEGQRLGVVDKSAGNPWERLAELGAISHISAGRLEDAKEMRDALGHAYPPANWRAVHSGVLVLMAELDRYIVNFERWARDAEILGSS